VSDDDLLKPCEVAEMLEVSSATVGYWARTGALKPFMRTPGGQRRYRRADVLAFRANAAAPAPEEEEADAVRLYEQGWPIRRVAAEFGFSYGKTRRILLRYTVLRRR
jgi:hypothetical protein